MEILPSVHLIDGVKGSNAYLLADDKLVLIDTGLPGNAKHILDFIKRQGREPKELAHIIITHAHSDHIGSVDELRATTGAKTVAHRDETTPTGDGGYVLWPDRQGQRSKLRDVLSRIASPKPSLVDCLVEDEDVLPYIGGLRIVHTPGHTPGSICLLLEKSGVLFAGDTMINNVDRLSRPLPFGSDRQASEQSLIKLSNLDFDICCFGHGPPLWEARNKVKRLATHYPRTPLYLRIARNWPRLLRFQLHNV